MKIAPNQWEKRVKHSVHSYIHNYLADKELLSQKDYKRAVKYAKQSADLTTLGKVYLTKCALDRTVGKKNICKEYQSIEKLITVPQLQSYKNFLEENLSEEDMQFLDPKYRSFARYYLHHQYKKSINVLRNTDDVVSMLVMGSFVEDKLSQDDIDKIINIASFYGYKKAVKFWLNYKTLKFNDLKSKEILKVIEN